MAGSSIDVNFDGIPGPTHNYAGLARGNLAAEKNARLVANPREAALQGLAKARALAARGYAQAVLPPHERPDVGALRALGFAGSDAEVVARAAREAPQLLAACSSAAAMWVANAATVSPSADTADGRVHFTPANLVAHFHRSLEAATTTRVLRAIFADATRFAVHEPLPAARSSATRARPTSRASRLVRAGAASSSSSTAAHAFDAAAPAPQRYPARQTREASIAIARRHGLDPAHCVFAQQHPDAIDAGVFHNDVIAVGHGNVLFCHERAWVAQDAVLDELGAKIGPGFAPIVVGARCPRPRRRRRDVPVQQPAASARGRPASAGRPGRVPRESARRRVSRRARRERWTDRRGADLRPAAEHAQRRRAGVPATLGHVDGRGARRPSRRACSSTTRSAQTSTRWIRRHYRDRLAPEDLGDPALVDESRRALDELTRILRLPAVYPFQL